LIPDGSKAGSRFLRLAMLSFLIPSYPPIALDQHFFFLCLLFLPCCRCVSSAVILLLSKWDCVPARSPLFFVFLIFTGQLFPSESELRDGLSLGIVTTKITLPLKVSKHLLRNPPSSTLLNPLSLLPPTSLPVASPASSNGHVLIVFSVVGLSAIESFPPFV